MKQATTITPEDKRFGHSCPQCGDSFSGATAREAKAKMQSHLFALPVGHQRADTPATTGAREEGNPRCELVWDGLRCERDAGHVGMCMTSRTYTEAQEKYTLAAIDTAFEISEEDRKTPATTGVRAECEFVTTWGKCDRRAETGKPYCVDHEHDMKTANRRRQASAPTTGVHTATPWHVAAKCSTMIIGADSTRVADTDLGSGIGMSAAENEANAAFIVRAVNNHNKLVAALKRIAHYECLNGGTCKPTWPYDQQCVYCTARAALTEVEK